jgi:hypothetical protein
MLCVNSNPSSCRRRLQWWFSVHTSLSNLTAAVASCKRLESSTQTLSNINDEHSDVQKFQTNELDFEGGRKLRFECLWC